MARVYLKPKSVDLPSQGDYLYQPRTKFFENTDQTLLETDVNNWLSTTQLALIDTFIVIEHIDYEPVTTRDSLPAPVVRHCCMVHYTEVQVN